MFETLFKYPRVLARHREGPVADARERFLTHCAEQGWRVRAPATYGPRDSNNCQAHRFNHRHGDQHP